ncbi:3824_t:CDS:2 [Rhizophagus irregularis]|nr:3824_t:CDS:2 [Rhizophagus irregularis]
MLNIEDQLNVLLETLPEERLCLHTLLAKHNKKDIYNTDKTGLFFQIEPNYTLDSGKISGQKQDKSHLSVLLYNNSTGFHKFSPLVIIEKANNFHRFKNINKASLPVTYCANSKI